MTKVFFFIPRRTDSLEEKKKKRKRDIRTQISILSLIQSTEAFTVIAFVLSKNNQLCSDAQKVLTDVILEKYIYLE